MKNKTTNDDLLALVEDCITKAGTVAYLADAVCMSRQTIYNVLNRNRANLYTQIRLRNFLNGIHHNNNNNNDKRQKKVHR